MPSPRSHRFTHFAALLALAAVVPLTTCSKETVGLSTLPPIRDGVNAAAPSSDEVLVGAGDIPRFSSTGTAVRDAVKPLWDDLYAVGAELVLNAHYDVYERFAPQTPAGVLDAAFGIRQFTVGTGGMGTGAVNTVQPNSEMRNPT